MADVFFIVLFLSNESSTFSVLSSIDKKSRWFLTTFLYILKESLDIFVALSRCGQMASLSVPLFVYHFNELFQCLQLLLNGKDYFKNGNSLLITLINANIVRLQNWMKRVFRYIGFGQSWYDWGSARNANTKYWNNICTKSQYCCTVAMFVFPNSTQGTKVEYQKTWANQSKWILNKSGKTPHQ